MIKNDKSFFISLQHMKNAAFKCPFIHIIGIERKCVVDSCKSLFISLKYIKHATLKVQCLKVARIEKKGLLKYIAGVHKIYASHHC